MLDQLLLQVHLQEETTFSNFYGGNNTTTLKVLKQLLEGKGKLFIYEGEPRALDARIYYRRSVTLLMLHRRRQCNLPLKMLQLSPSILKGLESKPLVYIDDIDTVLGRLDWEEALLHFYDRTQEFQKKISGD